MAGIYFKMDDVKGDATDANHAGSDGWIALGSIQFGIGRGIATPVGAAADRESSQPSVSEVVITKNLDKSSSDIVTNALSEKKGKKATVEFARTDEGGTPYYKIELEGVLVSGYSISSGGDRPSESISLNFTKISVTNYSVDAGADSNDPVTVGYDIGQAKML